MLGQHNLAEPTLPQLAQQLVLLNSLFLIKALVFQDCRIYLALVCLTDEKYRPVLLRAAEQQQDESDTFCMASHVDQLRSLR